MFKATAMLRAPCSTQARQSTMSHIRLTHSRPQPSYHGCQCSSGRNKWQVVHALSVSAPQSLCGLHYIILFLKVKVKEELASKRFRVRESEKTWSTFTGYFQEPSGRLLCLQLSSRGKCTEIERLTANHTTCVWGT